MVKLSQHHRNGTARTLALGLRQLAANFDSLAEQLALQEKVRYRDEEASVTSLRTGLDRIRMDQLDNAGRRRNEYFNLFAVIERTRCEHTHSNVLAWLLNPTEAHGLSDSFLKAFVKATFGDELTGTSDIVVERECENCDIVICQGRKWVLVIENKVDSIQGSDQLLRYARYWKRRFPKRYFAFLTRNGEEPACKDFVAVTYQVVRHILADLHGTGESEFFIRHFADHIWFS